jgi:hypothetical protein
MEPITTETIISGKVYCVTAECSPTATETVEKKLERLFAATFQTQKVIKLKSLKRLLCLKLYANILLIL